MQKRRDLPLDRDSEGSSGAKTQQNALGPARPWRRFAETLQTCAIVRSQRPIPGASLLHFSRPAPRTLQTCAIVRSQRPIPGASLLHFSRPAPRTLQTGAIVRSQRPIPGASLLHFSRPVPRTLQTSTKNPTDLRQRGNWQSPTTNVTITNHFCQLYPLSFHVPDLLDEFQQLGAVAVRV